MRTGRFLLCVIAACALTLAGCSQGSAPPDGANQQAGGGFKAANMVQLADAVSASSDSTRSAHVTMKASVNGASFVSGKGAFSLSKNDPAMKMTESIRLKQLFNQVKKQMADSGGDAVQLPGMEKVPSEIEMKIVLNGKTLYMKKPDGLPGGGSSGKPWSKVDLDSLGGGKMPQFSKMAQKANPTKQLEKFKKAGTITKTSSEQLDGQHVTHYSITVDTKKMLDELPKGNEKQEAQSEFGKSMPKSLPLELWINDKKLPLQMQMKASVAGMDVNMMMHYSDWGKPVTISAPPAGTVGAGPIPGMPGGSGSGDGH